MKKEKIVKDVFNLRNEGWSLQAIGEQLGYSREYIRLILKGKTNFAQKAIKKHNLVIKPESHCIISSSFTRTQVIQIIDLINSGESTKEVANKLDICVSTITKFLKEKRLEPLFKELNVDSEQLKKQLKHNNRKFSPEDIRHIFELNKTKSQAKIAKMYNTSQSNISSIVNGKIYKREIKEMGLTITSVKPRFTDQDIITMYELRKSGQSVNSIAERFKCNQVNISAILHGRMYKSVILKNNLHPFKKAN